MGEKDCTPEETKDKKQSVGDGKKVYKMIIVGGGPAGIGIIVRATRLGLLDQLLGEDLEKKQLGVALIHGGSSSTLGCGNLGSYTIKSNTFAKSLVNSIFEDRVDIEPPEKITGTFLEPLRNNPDVVSMVEAGNSPVNLADFGKLLSHVGSYVEQEILSRTSTCQCLTNTVVKGLEIQEDGLIKVHAVTVEINGQGLILSQKDHYLLAAKVVLAVGGSQKLPTFESPLHNKKAYTSDNILKEEGQDRLRNVLANSKNKKVCVVGGSHSAFSVAWTLLNRIDTCSSKFQNVNETAPIKFEQKDICIVHRGDIRCFYHSKREAEADGAVVITTDKSGSVNTFTGLREDAKRLYKNIKSGKETRAKLFQIKQGTNSILKKKLFDEAKAIVWCCGYETNMVPVSNYESKAILLDEERGQVKIDLKGRLCERRIIQVDSPKGKGSSIKAETIEPLDSILGIGLGFSLRASVDEMRTETRSDGVSVYQRRGASLVLAAVLGNAVYGKLNNSYEEMIQKQHTQQEKDKRIKDLCTESNHTNQIGCAPEVANVLPNENVTSTPVIKGSQINLQQPVDKKKTQTRQPNRLIQPSKFKSAPPSDCEKPCVKACRGKSLKSPKKNLTKKNLVLPQSTKALVTNSKPSLGLIYPENFETTLIENRNIKLLGHQRSKSASNVHVHLPVLKVSANNNSLECNGKDTSDIPKPILLATADRKAALSVGRCASMEIINKKQVINKIAVDCLIDAK